MQFRIVAVALAFAAVLLVSGSARAGPPCVCWPIDAGDAPTLETKGLSPERIGQETLKLLSPSMPVLGRMEVLRVAAAALQGHETVVERVVGRLCARVLDVETGKDEHPGRAWFDAGYAVEAFQQAGMLNRHGYDWIAKGLEKAAPEDKGAMHFGAALACLMKPHPRHKHFPEHLEGMRQAAQDDALLMKNFTMLQTRYPQLMKYFAGKK